ncbi:hypothetical protein [Micromonospora sp. Mcm103]|uniref:hypothetical protein n=1 Tax=Micromonospora sp. Mcm103 TaxID=2926015 RepID=UPI0021C892AB|nr:hypothetical protein [Micromonospora sp. Mcm103]
MIALLPHRHSATVPRRVSIGVPSGVTSAKSPRTSSGPSRYGVMVAAGVLSSSGMRRAVPVPVRPKPARDGGHAARRRTWVSRAVPVPGGPWS